MNPCLVILRGIFECALFCSRLALIENQEHLQTLRFMTDQKSLEYKLIGNKCAQEETAGRYLKAERSI